MAATTPPITDERTPLQRAIDQFTAAVTRQAERKKRLKRLATPPPPIQ